MKITSSAVKNYQFTLVIFLCLVALGISSFRNMPRSEDPALKIPAYNIVVVYPGANAVDMERLVAKPLEDRLKELDDIDKLQTTIRDGVAIIVIEFFYGTDPGKKYDDVLRQLNVERANLPADILSAEVFKIQTIDVALMQVALVSEEASYARLQDLAEDLKKDFERVPGIRQADKHAFPEKQVRVSLDLDNLARLAIPLDRVVAAIRASNANIPGGSVELGARRFNLKTSGNYGSIDEVRMTPVAGSGKAVVFLKDVADVQWSYEDKENFGRFNGQRAVFVTAKPRNGINIFDTRDGLRKVVEAFRGRLPGDVKLVAAFFQSVKVENRHGRL